MNDHSYHLEVPSNADGILESDKNKLKVKRRSYADVVKTGAQGARGPGHDHIYCYPSDMQIENSQDINNSIHTGAQGSGHDHVYYYQQDQCQDITASHNFHDHCYLSSTNDVSQSKSEKQVTITTPTISNSVLSSVLRSLPTLNSLPSRAI